MGAFFVIYWGGGLWAGFMFSDASFAPAPPSEVGPAIGEDAARVNHFARPADGQIAAESEDGNDEVERINDERHDFCPHGSARVACARNDVEHDLRRNAEEVGEYQHPQRSDA